MKKSSLVSKIKSVLEKEKAVIFVYIYGSILTDKHYRDIDIAVYAAQEPDPLALSANLTVALSKKTGIPPDNFDVRVINGVRDPTFLKRVLQGKLLIDKDFDERGDFIEAFSMRYRESEGILAEAF